MVQTSARLLALLSLLQVRREWTGPELAERLEVGPRTIRRDIEKLRSLGYPVQAAPGAAGGYRLGAGGELPPLLLDDAEAVAVAVGLRTAASGVISGMEESSVRALAKLEQILPLRLRRRVRAVGEATSTFSFEGPRVDVEVLTALATATRDTVSVRFAYTDRADSPSRRQVEPAGLVHTGVRWYLLAYDLDRDDWRTFRLDRITGRVQSGNRARRRPVPGGDAAAFVRERIRTGPGAGGGDEVPEERGRIRVAAPAEDVRRRVPSRWVEVEPDGQEACVVSTRGRWNRDFAVWMATLDLPMEVLGPPGLMDLAITVQARLAESVAAA